MSERDYTRTAWYILENTLEAETENEEERKYLEEYKRTNELLKSARQELNKLTEQLSTSVEMSNDELINLDIEHTLISKQINSYENKLQNLENKKPLQDIVERKRKQEYEKFFIKQVDVCKKEQEQNSINETKTTNTKKSFNNLFWIISCVIVIALIILAIISGLWEIIINIGNGSWVKGLIFLPFATIGVIQITRGIFAIFEKDLLLNIPDNLLSKRTQIFTTLYYIITIISLVILFIVIQNIA